MTILRPGKKRRDPLGMHKCANCDCEFVVQHADPLPAPDWQGDILLPCPECQRRVTLNSLVPVSEKPTP